MSSPDFSIDEAFIAKVTAYVEDFMSHYDPSHDFNHIRRVLHNALAIQAQTPGTNREIVRLAALLHDVGDRKYVKPGQDGERLVCEVLLELGAPPALAEKIQAICLGVSYNGEVKDPARVRALIGEHPELAVVQDADRLDAIGAVGIGRVFTFGGARGRSLGNSMEHFDYKLVKLEAHMKTDAGRVMAKERTERLMLMQEWWRLETEGIE
ncbi:hypothetical protein PT974_11194 [Cladobotryum mycophilum]|uniref:HD/PDEase domain-containing protein n=1 Tax=Cladobotryum mycophilum TaxID=491253 RepID=A0ABR0S5H9_9HYPO